MPISDYLTPEDLQIMLDETYGNQQTQNFIRPNPLQFQYPFIPGGITTQFDPRNFQSIFPTSGIRQQVPLQNLGIDTSYGVANEPDEEQVEYLTEQEPSGIAKLFEFLGKLPTPFNLARRGLESLRGLNDRIQGSDFGQSRTGAEYFMKRRERKQAERAQEAMPNVYRSARDQGFTNDRGGFSTNREDRAGTSVGSGRFSPKTSRGRSGY